MAFNEFFRRVRHKAVRVQAAYEGFMERQGFYVVLAICVVTILATAVFTNKNQKEIITPPPAGLLAAAEDASVQRLSDVQTPSPAPTVAVPTFTYPLAGENIVYRAFDGARPAYFESSNHWQLHRALDIKAKYGQSVMAVCDGTVQRIEQGTADGVMVVLSHAQGYESRYKGLLDAAIIAAGDQVRAGQTIGSAGNGPLLEQDEGAHVHIEILKNGICINPSDLF